MPHDLLSRVSFRERVSLRDGYKCVICGIKGYSHPDFSGTCPVLRKCGLAGVSLDAHHILERRLWDDGGYYLDNGATLCDVQKKGTSSCHLLAEQTLISCETIRQATGITVALLPAHFYRDAVYDKWGNILNPNGTRTPGELFGDESIRKVLRAGGVMGQFGEYIKYPRTYHLPWSPGKTDDDRTMENTSAFEGRRVIVTEKMDGENTTMYRNYIHARSIDSSGHPSREWVKNYHSKIAWNIPEGWRFCGENMYAQHTLGYDKLPSYFLLFSIWDESNSCLGWDETVEYAAVLNIQMVPILYDGIWSEKLVRGFEKTIDLSAHEGYVVRLAENFHYGAFRRSVAKYVRAAHVGTGHNWMSRIVVRNHTLS